MKKFLFITFVFLLFFSFFELLSKVTHPDLARNQIHKFVDSDKTISKSKNTWYKFFDIKDNVKYRFHKKTSEFYDDDENHFNNNTKNVFVFGDSVTGGFGVNFQDTYFYHSKILINEVLEKEDQLNIYSIARFGNNFRDMLMGIEYIEKLLKENDIIIYQFNYNDLVEVNYNPAPNTIEVKQPSKIVINFNDWRKSFLNKSTLMRVMQHYAGNFKWKMQKLSSAKQFIRNRELFKKCGNLGFTTLGQYTYSYGAKQFKEKSLEIWNLFEIDLILLNDYLKLKKLNFGVILSPISLQIPHHEKINHRNLNFNCSTIDAHKKITEILTQNNIDVIDPTNDFIKYSKITYQNDNSNYLFHPYDTNHPNETGHYLMGKKLYSYIYNLLKN